MVTIGQGSVYGIITQRPEMHGPPRYLTPNWDEVEKSVWLLEDLESEIIMTGHRRPLHGEKMRARLHEPAKNLVAIAVSEDRRYALEPAKPGWISNAHRHLNKVRYQPASQLLEHLLLMRFEPRTRFSDHASREAHRCSDIDPVSRPSPCETSR